MANQQATIDALTNLVKSLDGTIQTIETEIEALEASSPTPEDFTALNAAVEQIKVDIGTVQTTLSSPAPVPAPAEPPKS